MNVEMKEKSYAKVNIFLKFQPISCKKHLRGFPQAGQLTMSGLWGFHTPPFVENLNGNDHTGVKLSVASQIFLTLGA